MPDHIEITLSKNERKRYEDLFSKYKEKDSDVSFF